MGWIMDTGDIIWHGMPAIVFELGDNTPRPFLKEKGKVAAEELMKLLLRE